MPRKEDPGVGGGGGARKWDERKELWEEKEDEEWLKPKWQRLHLHPLFPWSRPTLLPALLFHISHSLPPSLSLAISISLFSCSLADLLRQRGEEFRRFKGSSVETACHVGATAALPADFTDSCCYNWSSTSSPPTAATSELSGAPLLINSSLKLDATLHKRIWHKNWLVFNHTRSRETRRNYSKIICDYRNTSRKQR